MFGTCNDCGCASHECECADRKSDEQPTSPLIGRRVALYKGTAEILQHSEHNDRYQVKWAYPGEKIEMIRWIDSEEICRFL